MLHIRNYKGLKRRIALAFLLSLTGINSLVAQEDTILLQTVNITACRLYYYSNRINVQESDSFMMAQARTQNLAEVLFGTAGIQSRSYGLGGISSMALRNGNSYQTAVLWKGINLQDPLNGGVDVSQLPGFFFDQITLHYGGAAALFGSGSMGGSVVLHSLNPFNKGLSVEAFGLGGSFNHFQQGAKFRYSAKNVSTGIKLYHRQARNDFPYKNTSVAGSPTERQQNAAYEQWGLLQENAIRLGKKQRLSADFWLFSSDNQVPSTMSQTIASGANNLNHNAKGVLSYSIDGKMFDFNLRSALLFNELKYNDLVANEIYKHSSFASVNEAAVTYQSNYLAWNLGVNHITDRGLSESLLSNEQRHRSAFFGLIRWSPQFLQKISLVANIRQEFLKATALPFVWSVKMRYEPRVHWAFFASHTRQYRVPTFNDLYWQDAFSKGNPNLNAEKGFTSDLGIGWYRLNSTVFISFKANLYHSITQNLIQWIPENGIWIPKNFDEVESMGMESTLKNEYRFWKSRWRFEFSYALNHVTMTKSALYDEEVLGKQMIFVPMHSGTALFRWSWKQWFAEYKQIFNGRVYTQADHGASIDPYALANFSIGYNFPVKKSMYSASARILNLWNSAYQLMPAYAMPGINYELSLTYKFSKP